MRLKLKGTTLLELSKARNIHQFGLRAGVSATTAHKYVHGGVESVNLEVLAALLIKGAGLTPEQALELKVGDLFEFE